MKWFVRFALWSIVLAYPCVLLSGPYQNLLVAMVSTLFGIPFHPDPRAGADLSASNMLGVYASMCLASLHSPWPTRLRALGIGVVAMTLIEFATGLISILGSPILDAPQTSAAVKKVFETLIALPRFTSAPAIWLLLLSRYELPESVRASMGRLGAPERRAR